jgi:hypothetical protein
MTTGTIGRYRWAESDLTAQDVRLPDVIRALADHVRGLRAVNVSWDSGRLLRANMEIDSKWSFVDGYAVSPPIEDDLIANWPYSGDGFDEWYFVPVLPARIALDAWCNWMHSVLTQHEELAFPGGVDLARQLEDCAPRLVVGQGLRLYMLALDEEPIDDFCSLFGS